MKVKLLRIFDYSRIESYNYGDDELTIRFPICNGLSDWEEIDDSSFSRLQSFVSSYNSNKNNKNKYLIATESDITAKFAIEEQLKKEEEINRKHLEAQRKSREDYEKIQYQRQKKREEKEKKKLAELQAKYGNK